MNVGRSNYNMNNNMKRFAFLPWYQTNRGIQENIVNLPNHYARLIITHFINLTSDHADMENKGKDDA